MSNETSKTNYITNTIKYFYIPIILLAFTACTSIYNFSVDTFWMAYEGSKNYITDYVQQQFIFNKIIYFLYLIINYEYSCLIATIIMLIGFSIYWFKCKRTPCVKVGVLSMFCMYFYTALTLRPWIISSVCMVAVYYIYSERSKYFKEHRILKYLLTGILSIIMANFQSATIPFFIIFICVRGFDNLLCKNWKGLTDKVIGIIISILCSFINPFGWKAIVYLLEGYGKASKIGIKEMMPPQFISMETLAIITTIIILFKMKEKTTIGEKICSIVLCLLTAMCSRNIYILGCSMFFIFKEYIYDNFTIIDKKQKVERDLFLTLIPILFFTALYNCSFNEINQKNEITISDEALNALNEVYNDNCIIYNSPNIGGYLEFNGIKNVYGDCRPELMDNEKFEDFIIATDDACYSKEFINKYNFDIIITYHLFKVDNKIEAVIGDMNYTEIYHDDCNSIYVKN